LRPQAACLRGRTGEAACLPYLFLVNFRHACVFIDGENLRHSLCDLFGADFNPADYLPKQANWEEFFRYLVTQASSDLRLRTYWYVVEELDFWPYNIDRLLKQADFITLEKLIRRHKPHAAAMDAIADPSARRTRVEIIARDLLKIENAIKRRFDGWKELQNGITRKFDSVEFRRAGSIRMNLFTEEFGDEKGVDVKLATDLLKLAGIYEVAIIVSGDGDYVPAVQAAKDQGKHVVNVSFLKKSGGVLPGGARRLNQAADRAIEVAYDDMKAFMKIGLPVVAADGAGSSMLAPSPANPMVPCQPTAVPPGTQK